MQLQGKNWFVKTNGVFRGPFDADTVRSMRNRNRIDPSSEISDDRVNWNPAHQFPELFPEPEPIPNGEDETPSEISGNQTQYFYNDNGNQMGPVSFARLQELANSGRIRSTDLIWYEGAKGWHPASEIKELRFLTDTTVTKNWLSQNKPIVAFASFALMILILIPAGYVIGESWSRKQKKEAGLLREIDLAKSIFAEREATITRLKELKNQEIQLRDRAAVDREERRRHEENIKSQAELENKIADLEDSFRGKIQSLTSQNTKNTQDVVKAIKSLEDYFKTGF
ncbi:MAG: DUF4339 domain-containing protein [Planctomycetota bacterium]